MNNLQCTTPCVSVQVQLTECTWVLHCWEWALIFLYRIHLIYSFHFNACLKSVKCSFSTLDVYFLRHAVQIYIYVCWLDVSESRCSWGILAVGSYGPRLAGWNVSVAAILGRLCPQKGESTLACVNLPRLFFCALNIRYFHNWFILFSSQTVSVLCTFVW